MAWHGMAGWRIGARIAGVPYEVHLSLMGHGIYFHHMETRSREWRKHIRDTFAQIKSRRLSGFDTDHLLK